jgi:hypothetical protein
MRPADQESAAVFHCSPLLPAPSRPYQRRYATGMHKSVPDNDGCCQPVPGHPSQHGANTETGRSRPMQRRSYPPPREAFPTARNAGPEVASATDTIRNLACVGYMAGRREMDLPYTCRIPRLGSRSPIRAVPPIGLQGDAAASMSPLVRSSRSAWGNPVAAEATAGILKGTSRSGRLPPSRSRQYRTVGIPIAVRRDRSGRLPRVRPRAASLWWNPVFWVGVHGGSHRGESQP